MKKILKILILIILLTSYVNAETKNILNSKVYKIGLPEVPGLMFRNNKGEPKGLPMEVLIEALDEGNIKYEIIDGSWHDLYHKAINKEIDLLPGTIITEDRKLLLDFCDESLYLIWSEVFIKKDADYNHLSDFNGKKIGLVFDDYNAIGFENYIKDFHIDYEKIYFSSHKEASDAVRNGEIFGLVGPNPNILNNMLIGLKRSGLYFNPNYLTYAFPKNTNSQLREYLNIKLAEYKKDAKSKYNILLNAYRISHISPNEAFFPNWLVYTLIIIAISLVVVLIFVILLRKQVIAKTKALSEKQQTLINAFQIGKMGYWEINLENMKLYRSDEMLKLLKMSSGKHYFSNSEMKKNFHKVDYNKADEYIKKIIESEQIVENELQMIDTEGNIIHTLQIGYLTKDLSGKKNKIVGITQNISERKLYEKQLIEAKNKAEESEKLKSAFLANMSHEIRTPLNAIVGFSSLIAKENIEEEERINFTEIIIKQKDLLLNLINDIIDFSKIEAGTIDINIKSYNNIFSVVDEVYDIFKDKADSNIEIRKVHAHQNRVCGVDVDMNRVRQIISNFMTNSIKFTEKGFIEVGCRFNEIYGQIEIYVRDTGIGIDKINQEKIFERFTQLNSFSQGTGLGLSISKYLAEKMNCQIRLNSENSQGSEFILAITPSKIGEESDIPNQIDIDVKNYSEIKIIKILIAEDVESNYVLVKNYLRDKIYDLTWVKNGAEAVKLCNSVDYNVVLMDIKMPIMDGLEATKIIKSNNKKLPIIALTAYALDSDKEMAFSAGCDDFMTKPVEKQELINKISSLVA